MYLAWVIAFFFKIQIQATDKGVPPRSSSVRVRIDVYPRPLKSKHVLMPKPIDPVAVAENDAVGQVVTFLQTEGSDNSLLWYSIVGKYI